MTSGTMMGHEQTNRIRLDGTCRVCARLWVAGCLKSCVWGGVGRCSSLSLFLSLSLCVCVYLREGEGDRSVQSARVLMLCLLWVNGVLEATSCCSHPLFLHCRKAPGAAFEHAFVLMLHLTRLSTLRPLCSVPCLSHLPSTVCVCVCVCVCVNHVFVLIGLTRCSETCALYPAVPRIVHSRLLVVGSLFPA